MAPSRTAGHSGITQYRRFDRARTIAVPAYKGHMEHVGLRSLP